MVFIKQVIILDEIALLINLFLNCCIYELLKIGIPIMNNINVYVIFSTHFAVCAVFKREETLI